MENTSESANTTVPKTEGKKWHLVIIGVLLFPVGGLVVTLISFLIAFLFFYNDPIALVDSPVLLIPQILGGITVFVGFWLILKGIGFKMSSSSENHAVGEWSLLKKTVQIIIAIMLGSSTSFAIQTAFPVLEFLMFMPFILIISYYFLITKFWPQKKLNN